MLKKILGSIKGAAVAKDISLAPAEQPVKPEEQPAPKARQDAFGEGGARAPAATPDAAEFAFFGQKSLDLGDGSASPTEPKPAAAPEEKKAESLDTTQVSLLASL
jgi:hypothetical protein